MKKCIHILILCTLYNSGLFAQTGLRAAGFSFTHFESRHIPSWKDSIRLRPLQEVKEPKTVFPDLKQGIRAPKIYSVEELAFFCRIEVKLEKRVALPVKFRLGTLDYVDRLEQKGRY